MFLMFVINLFFTPVSGLFLFCNRKHISFSASLYLLFLYVIFVTCNIPIVHCFMVCARKFGVLVTLDSGFYTLFALASSLIVYALAVLFSEYVHIQLRVEKKDEN